MPDVTEYQSFSPLTTVISLASADLQTSQHTCLHLTGSLPLCIPSACAIMCKQLCKPTGLFLPSGKERELYRQGVKLEASLSVRMLPSVLQQKAHFVQKLWVLSDTKRKSCLYHIPVLSTTRPALSKKLLQLSKIISLQDHCYPSNSLQKQSVF